MYQKKLENKKDGVTFAAWGYDDKEAGGQPVFAAGVFDRTDGIYKGIVEAKIVNGEKTIVVSQKRLQQLGFKLEIDKSNWDRE